VYDELSRVASVRQCGGGRYIAGFAHDPFGNLITQDATSYSYETSDPHQVATVTAGSATSAIEHDPNGNMTLLPQGRRAVWNAEGHLVRVEEGVSTTLATYAYDYTGRRVAAKGFGRTTYFFDDFDLRGTTATRHVRAGAMLIASSTVTGVTFLYIAAAEHRSVVLLAQGVVGVTTLGLVGLVLASRRGRRPRPLVAVLVAASVLDAGVRAPLAWAQCDPPEPDPTAGTIFYHVDHLGTPQLLTDQSGAVLERHVTRPYGERATYTATGVPLAATMAAFTFTGQRVEDGTGLMYFGARYYAASLARFVSLDPARQFFSPYSYLDGNPLNGTDPTGASGDFSSDELGFGGSLVDKPSGGSSGAFLDDRESYGYGSRDDPYDSGYGDDPYGYGYSYFDRLYGPSCLATCDLNFLLDDLQLALDVGGTVPGFGEPLDLISAGVSLLREDYVSFALSLGAAAAPVGGQAFTAAKYGGRLYDSRITTVIGSRADTLVAKGWPLHNVLDVPVWRASTNIRWLDRSIARGDSIYLATDPVRHERFLRSLGYQTRPYSAFLDLELPYLRARGYEQVGTYMVPPSWLR
jgi:RHS repeat-associated protein